MKISANGLRFIQREEGCVLRVYLDNHGFATAGVGHLVRPGDGLGPVGTPITQAKADALLAADLAEVEAAIDRLGVRLGQNERDAIGSFVFNLGTGILDPKKHTLAAFLARGDKNSAALDFPLYDMSAGVHDPALHARRLREQALFLTPDGSVPAEPHPWDVTTTKGLQRALNALGASPRLSVDGAFGSHTKAALVAFQAAHGLTADGVPGSKTRAALGGALAAVHEDA